MEVTLQKPELVRRPHFAGESYPQDPAELGETIDMRIAATSRPELVKGEIGAIITPSTAVSLYGAGELGAMRALLRKKYATVIVIASAQQSFFDYSSVYLGGAYATPLGRIFVDLPMAERMAHSHPRVVFSGLGHTGGTDAEYAIEMVLPFLQKLLGDFRMVPIVMGSEDDENVVAVGEVLTTVTDPQKTLIVGCSELLFNTHSATDKIELIVDAAGKLEWRTLYDRLRNAQVPSTAPFAAITYAARRLRIKRAETLIDSNSDDTTLSVVMLR